MNFPEKIEPIEPLARLRLLQSTVEESEKNLSNEIHRVYKPDALVDYQTDSLAWEPYEVVGPYDKFKIMTEDFSNEHCDFCYSTNVVHHFECLDFDSASEDAGVIYAADTTPTNVILASSDFWAACPECKEMVEKEDVVSLVRRAIEKDGNMLSLSNQFVVSVHLLRTYKIFFKLRIKDGANRSLNRYCKSMGR